MQAWQVQHPRGPGQLLRLHEGGRDRGEAGRDDCRPINRGHPLPRLSDHLVGPDILVGA